MEELNFSDRLIDSWSIRFQNFSKFFACFCSLIRDSLLRIRFILYGISFQNFEIWILKNSRCEQTHSKQFRFQNQTQLITCLRSSLEMTLPKCHSETVKIKPSGSYKNGPYEIFQSIRRGLRTEYAHVILKTFYTICIWLLNTHPWNI